MTSPAFAYASFHARSAGSVRSQLMHVNVQKSTSTTLPWRSVGDNGLLFSHSLAPANPGMCPLTGSGAWRNSLTFTVSPHEAKPSTRAHDSAAPYAASTKTRRRADARADRY